MTNSIKLILAAAAAIFAFAACSSNDPAPTMPTTPSNDGGVYSNK